MIVWITHAKVGHRQAPSKHKGPPRAGLCFWCAIFDRAKLHRAELRSIAPGFDFGDPRIAAAGSGDVDADAIGGEGGEGDGAFDEAVCGHDAESDPSATRPALDGEVDQAIEAEGHRVGGL